jgi:hypothetical protein
MSKLKPHCPARIQPHINDNNDIKCYKGANALRIAQPVPDNESPVCEGDQDLVNWYFMDIEVGSGEITAFAHQVDQILSPDASTGAVCSFVTTEDLSNSFTAATMPALAVKFSVDVPSCSAQCLSPIFRNTRERDALSVKSAGICESPPVGGGKECDITCKDGFVQSGPNPTCDNGKYASNFKCIATATACVIADAQQETGVPIVGLTAKSDACGLVTAQNTECYANCDSGFYSTGYLKCIPSASGTRSVWVSEGIKCNKAADGTNGGAKSRVTQTLPFSCSIDGTEHGNYVESNSIATGISLEPASPIRTKIIVDGFNFDPAADAIVVIPRAECSLQSCARASTFYDNTIIQCNSPESSATRLVCGDGILTGLLNQPSAHDLGMVCICDGSSRGGCKSLGDFLVNGPNVGNLSGHSPAEFCQPGDPVELTRRFTTNLGDARGDNELQPAAPSSKMCVPMPARSDQASSLLNFDVLHNRPRKIKYADLHNSADQHSLRCIFTLDQHVTNADGDYARAPNKKYGRSKCPSTAAALNDAIGDDVITCIRRTGLDGGDALAVSQVAKCCKKTPPPLHIANQQGSRTDWLSNPTKLCVEGRMLCFTSPNAAYTQLR